MKNNAIGVSLGLAVLVVAATGGVWSGYALACCVVPAPYKVPEYEMNRVLSSAEAEIEAKRVLRAEFKTRRSNPMYWFESRAKLDAMEAQDLLFWVLSNSNDAQHLRVKLRNALNEKIISEDEYYRELSNLLFEQGAEHMDLFREIIASHNEYGLMALFSVLGGLPAGLEGFNPTEKQEVLVGLLSAKPKFNIDMSLLGIGSLAQFEHWAQSLENAYEGPSFDDFLYEKVITNAEARELIALDSAGYLERLRETPKKYDMTTVDQHIRDYQASYPNNEVANSALLQKEYRKNRIRELQDNSNTKEE